MVLASLSNGGYAAFDFVPAAVQDPMAALQLLLGAVRQTKCSETHPKAMAEPCSSHVTHVFFPMFYCSSKQ